MSQRAPKHSDPVVGRILNQAELAAQRSSAATRARIRVGMVAAVVVLALATVVFGVLADRVAVARAPVEAAAPEPARPVKRPMAAGTNEDHIARWVPVRTPSGRTELEAWTTVDAEWLKSSDTLDMV
ncbi:MAG TPA: hypothetical protein QGH10_15100, partial [Armatimonadota bacterium]|nr:hypothetical protein [Armatimonadota bacterium]